MFLTLDQKGVPMKQVYSHYEMLKSDPERVAAAQALTLDVSKPLFGLKGSHGLYGSAEWWNSIHQGRMPLKFVSGVVERVYVAGQDGGDENNQIDLLLDDGTHREEGIYVNDKADIAHFRVGCRVDFVFVLDELKRQPSPGGGCNYLEIPLEVAISTEPVA